MRDWHNIRIRTKPLSRVSLTIIHYRSFKRHAVEEYVISLTVRIDDVLMNDNIKALLINTKLHIK